MKTRKFMALILSASMFLAACGGAGSGSEGSTADKDPLVINENDKSQIAKIQIVAENNVESTEGLLSIESGNSTNLKLWAIYDNNESKEITSDVEWVVESLGIIDLENNVNTTTALAKSPGITSITASYNHLTTVESFIVPTPSTCFKTEKDTIKGLTEACNNEKILVIPPKIDGIVITEIGSYAFDKNTNLQNVSMPSVETIGDSAFRSTSSLQSVSMPLVKTIDRQAFNGTALKNISMPSVESIDVSAFVNNPQLESVSMPLVKTIGKEAFAGTGLQSVSMPLVTTIDVSAFVNTRQLESVSMPLVKTIDKRAFEDTALKNISMPSVESIDFAAFANNPQLESVSMPLVKTIGKQAFYVNSSKKGLKIELKNVSMPQVETIGDDAFSHYSYTKYEIITSLKNISMPSVRIISDGAFANNPQLESVSMPQVETIGDKAFSLNMKLTNVIISEPELINFLRFQATPFANNNNYICDKSQGSNDNKPSYYHCIVK